MQLGPEIDFNYLGGEIQRLNILLARAIGNITAARSESSEKDKKIEELQAALDEYEKKK